VKTELQTPGTVRNREPRAAAAVHDILRRIEGEYREMPGMCVTAPQAQRLWGLDATTCDVVLRTLVDCRVLRRTPRGTFVKC
jgi:hypothetical protein